MIKFNQYITESLSARPAMDAFKIIHDDPENGCIYSFAVGSVVYQLRMDVVQRRSTGNTFYYMDFGVVPATDFRPETTKDEFEKDFSHAKMLSFSVTSHQTPFAVFSGVVYGIQLSLKKLKAEIGSELHFKGNTSVKQRVYDRIASKFAQQGILDITTDDMGKKHYTIVKLPS